MIPPPCWRHYRGVPMRFDRYAQSYDAHATPQHAFAEKVAAFIRFLPHEPVLELGAGTGALTRHLFAVTSNLCATDASLEMLNLGRLAVPGARWEQLDAFRSRLPLSRLQVSSGLLQWAEDPVAVLRHWATALLPGGRMVHAVPCHPCLQEWRGLVPESPVQWHDETQWQQRVQTAGLRVTRTERWTLRGHLPSALDLVRGLHRSGVTGAVRLGAGRLRAALRTYDREFRDGAGVYATWAWFAFEADP